MSNKKIPDKKRGNLNYSWCSFSGGQILIYEYKEEKRENGLIVEKKTGKEWKFGNEKKAKEFWENL